MRAHSKLYPAGFWIRAAALLLDALIVGVLCLGVRLPLSVLGFLNSSVNPVILFHFTLADVVCYLLSTTYFVLLTARTGSTLGKKAMGIRVVSMDGMEKPSFQEVLYRETVGRYLTSFACIGYLYAAADDEKRGFHDLLSDTRVIYACDAARKAEIQLVAEPESEQICKNEIIVGGNNHG